MRVSDVTSGYTSIRQLQNLQTLQQTQQERLVSGRRINQIEEDPNTASDVLKSRATRETMIQMRDNAVRADSIAGTGISTLDYLRSVADQAQSIINSDNVRGIVSAEHVDDLMKDALSAANAQLGGDYLFGGSVTSAAPFAIDEASGQVVYSGAGEGRAFNVSEGVSLSPFTGNDTHQDIATLLNSLAALRDAFAAGDEAALPAIATSLGQAEDSLVDAAGALGMKQFRIEMVQARDAEKYAALDMDETRATAADENETIVNLLNTQKAYQGALQSVAKLNELSLLTYV